jgi:hypothetical protein
MDWKKATQGLRGGRGVRDRTFRATKTVRVAPQVSWIEIRRMTTRTGSAIDDPGTYAEAGIRAA